MLPALPTPPTSRHGWSVPIPVNRRLKWGCLCGPTQYVRRFGVSSVFGGNGPDTGYAIAVDTSGNAYITGSTKPYGNGPWIDFPTIPTPFNVVELATRPGSGETQLGRYRPQVLRLSRQRLCVAVWGTAIALDAQGRVYLAGSTSSPNFPVTSGAVQTKPGEVAATLIRRICTRMPATHSFTNRSLDATTVHALVRGDSASLKPKLCFSRRNRQLLRRGDRPGRRR